MIVAPIPPFWGVVVEPSALTNMNLLQHSGNIRFCQHVPYHRNWSHVLKLFWLYTEIGDSLRNLPRAEPQLLGTFSLVETLSLSAPESSLHAACSNMGSCRQGILSVFQQIS